MTRTDPKCRRTLARQRLCRMRLRQAGMLALTGYTPEPGADVQRTWRRHGWQPSGRVCVVTVEYRPAA